METQDIFERLRNGELIISDDAQAFKMRESYATKALLLKMNNASNPSEIRELLSKITATEIHESVTVFTPLHINGNI